MSFLEIKKVGKSFGSQEIVKQLDIDLEAGKTLSILGKSGCGKTTMLKMIAGLESPDEGSIKLGGTIMNSVPPAKRGIVYLYQEDLLFPHLSVYENIAFGLRIQRKDKSYIDKEVRRMIAELQLEGHADKMPEAISGGQRQRVSFGRAIITNPSLLLLDEPFGSLDAGTRKDMQGLFTDLSATYKITSLFVTHDMKEAILMGDEIGLMREGRLKIYKSQQAFLADPDTGVANEIDFWGGLTSKKSE